MGVGDHQWRVQDCVAQRPQIVQQPLVPAGIERRRRRFRRSNWRRRHFPLHWRRRFNRDRWRRHWRSARDRGRRCQRDWHRTASRRGRWRRRLCWPVTVCGWDVSGAVARHGCPTDDTHHAGYNRGAQGKQRGPHPRVRPGVPLGGVIGFVSLERPRLIGHRSGPGSVDPRPAVSVKIVLGSVTARWCPEGPTTLRPGRRAPPKPPGRAGVFLQDPRPPPRRKKC